MAISFLCDHLQSSDIKNPLSGHNFGVSDVTRENENQPQISRQANEQGDSAGYRLV